MHPVRDRNVFFVKEHVGFLKAANNYDFLDPETGEEVLHCREDKLGFFTSLLRFTDYKRYTPFNVSVRTPAGEPVVSVRRGVAVFQSHVRVYDGSGQLIGGFKQKMFTLIRQKFQVLDENDQPLCELKGSWSSWDFRFVAGESELAHVTKKWSGLGKELFTSADNYVLTINEAVPPDSRLRQLIVAAVVCIDMVLKE